MGAAVQLRLCVYTPGFAKTAPDYTAQVSWRFLQLAFASAGKVHGGVEKRGKTLWEHKESHYGRFR